jgi:hypothetical protein
MSSEACRNIRIALRFLGYELPDNNTYDEAVERAITALQLDERHLYVDGYTGPGTRRLLTRTLLKKGGERLFLTMKHPEGDQPPLVFLSYSWKDTDIVNKIDQWLRDQDIRVLRDNRDFRPGTAIPEAILESIVQADKVIAIYSSKSRQRDWPRFEISIAEKEEQIGRRHLLIYLVLDNTPLPAHDPHRIAVMAKGRTLREVGQDLLRGILGEKAEPPRFEYDENEKL